MYVSVCVPIYIYIAINSYLFVYLFINVKIVLQGSPTLHAELVHGQHSHHTVPMNSEPPKVMGKVVKVKFSVQFPM